MEQPGDARDTLKAALRRVTARLDSDPDAIDALFERAQILARLGQDDAAKAAFLAVLECDPAHFGALTDLGGLALSTGFRSAALTAYRQAASCHPENPRGLVNLANMLLEDGDLAAAKSLYESALRIDPELAYAHQGLAHILTKSGDRAAAVIHQRRGYAQHAVVTRPYRGTGEPLRVLLIVSIHGGNIPTELLLDDRIFAVSALYAEFHDASRPLPAHDIVFNAIGDADLCSESLDNVAAILARSEAPVVNPPEAIVDTGRNANARRLAEIEGVIVPHIVEWRRGLFESRDAGHLLQAEGLTFPLLLRSPGFHTGQNFTRVEHAGDLAASARELPGDTLLAIQFLDAAGSDGLVRKYRVMTITGALYPLHLAISRSWKVHYFTSAMAEDSAFRAEEARFLTNMADALGRLAMDGLKRLAAALALDYGGIDFGISPDGRVLLFEANATMAIVPPSAEPIWDYRRASASAAIEALRRMLFARAKQDKSAIWQFEPY